MSRERQYQRLLGDLDRALRTGREAEIADAITEINGLLNGGNRRHQLEVLAAAAGQSRVPTHHLVRALEHRALRVTGINLRAFQDVLRGSYDGSLSSGHLGLAVPPGI